jgi:hypothetical protein
MSGRQLIEVQVRYRRQRERHCQMRVVPQYGVDFAGIRTGVSALDSNIEFRG